MIAQRPAERRDQSRLLVYDRITGKTEHKNFSDILEYLRPGDLLVMNDSKVIHARLFGIKESTGAKIELFLIKKSDKNRWELLAKPAKRLKSGDKVNIADNLYAEVIKKTEDGGLIVEFSDNEKIEKYGKMPLPPYIRRDADKSDEERYQTVYSKTPGSVASPTAGLHITKELLEKAKKMGVQTAFVTLHVGLGTFRPVKTDLIEDHHMHSEEYFISEETAGKINQTKAGGRRVICVGTTSVRTLESAAAEGTTSVQSKVLDTTFMEKAPGIEKNTGISHKNYSIKPGSGKTDIFIYPGYDFKVCDALITNFHLPKSTLLMLVSAFAGHEEIMKVYNTAVKENYRFFSYGDAMLIL